MIIIAIMYALHNSMLLLSLTKQFLYEFFLHANYLLKYSSLNDIVEKNVRKINCFWPLKEL